MKTLQTPVNIEVLLHCHVCPRPHPRADSPAVAEALHLLHRCGAIVPVLDFGGGSHFETTSLGRAWVAALCQVPQPKQVFVDAQGQML